GLPTTLLAGGVKGGDACPASQKLDEAVVKQQDLLAEFEKIADELNRILANLKGSTLVKRLKAASRLQYRVAGRLGDLVGDAFGVVAAAPKGVPAGQAVADPKAVRNARTIQDKLAARVTVNKGNRAEPLRDALELFSDRYGLDIRVDNKAFEAAGLRDVESRPIKFPRLVGVPLGEALNQVLSQVQGAYVVRRDGVEITTKQRALAENRQREAADKTPRGPQGDLFTDLSGQEARSSQDVSNIMDDMQAYFERRRFVQLKNVLDEMVKQ